MAIRSARFALSLLMVAWASGLALRLDYVVEPFDRAYGSWLGVDQTVGLFLGAILLLSAGKVAFGDRQAAALHGVSIVVLAGVTFLAGLADGMEPLHHQLLATALLLVGITASRMLTTRLCQKAAVPGPSCHPPTAAAASLRGPG